MDSVKDRLGNMVREKRNIHRITQEQLAEKVGVTTGMIGQMERGETMPSIETLAALIEQLNIDPRVLFGGSAPQDPEYAELCSIIARMTPMQRHLLLKIAKAIRE